MQAPEPSSELEPRHPSVELRAQRRGWLAAAVAALVLFSAACFQLEDYAGQKCDSDRPGYGCLDGRRCYKGICMDPSQIPVPGDKDGGREDSGNPQVTDGSVPDSGVPDSGVPDSGVQGDGGVLFAEDFESFSVGSWAKGSTQAGRWLVQSTGTTSVVTDGSKVLLLEPTVTTPGALNFLTLVSVPNAFADVDATVLVKWGDSGAFTQHAELRWRVTGGDYHYAGVFLFNGSNQIIEIGRANSGSRSMSDQIPVTGTPLSGWVTLRAVHVGQKITVFVNGSPVVSNRTDTNSHASGGVALAADSVPVAFDNLRVVSP